MGELQRRGLRAQGVGLAVQFLDQEIQPLADLAALDDQPLDLVDVRAQAHQLLGHVDPDGEGRCLGQGPVLRGFGQRRPLGQRHGLLPALQEAGALLRHQFGHERLGLGGQAAQLFQVPQQHGRQPGAFALARRHQVVQGPAGQARQGPGPVDVGARVGGREPHRIGHAQGRGVG